MARGVYTLTMKDVTLATAAAQTLLFINPGTTASLRMYRISCGQGGTATSQELIAQVVTQPTGFPTLTSSAPVPTSPIDQASKIVGGTAGAAGTSGTNASAEGTGGKTVLIADTFNNLNGWTYVWLPEERPVLSAGGLSGFGLYLPLAPTTNTRWSATLTFEEI